jgi:hypothetical protein
MKKEAIQTGPPLLFFSERGVKDIFRSDERLAVIAGPWLNAGC